MASFAEPRKSRYKVKFHMRDKGSEFEQTNKITARKSAFVTPIGDKNNNLGQIVLKKVEKVDLYQYSTPDHLDQEGKGSQHLRRAQKNTPADHQLYYKRFVDKGNENPTCVASHHSSAKERKLGQTRLQGKRVSSQPVENKFGKVGAPLRDNFGTYLPSMKAQKTDVTELTQPDSANRRIQGVQLSYNKAKSRSPTRAGSLPHAIHEPDNETVPHSDQLIRRRAHIPAAVAQNSYDPSFAGNNDHKHIDISQFKEGIRILSTKRGTLPEEKKEHSQHENPKVMIDLTQSKVLATNSHNHSRIKRANLQTQEDATKPQLFGSRSAILTKNMPSQRNIEDLPHQHHYYYENVQENQPYQSGGGPTIIEPALGPTPTQDDLQRRPQYQSLNSGFEPNGNQKQLRRNHHSIQVQPQPTRIMQSFLENDLACSSMSDQMVQDLLDSGKKQKESESRFRLNMHAKLFPTASISSLQVTKRVSNASSIESVESYSLDGGRDNNKKGILMLSASTSGKKNAMKRGRAKIVLGNMQQQQLNPTNKSREPSLGDSNTGGELENFFNHVHGRISQPTENLMELSDQKQTDREDPIFDKVRNLIPQFSAEPIQTHVNTQPCDTKDNSGILPLFHINNLSLTGMRPPRMSMNASEEILISDETNHLMVTNQQANNNSEIKPINAQDDSLLYKNQTPLSNNSQQTPFQTSTKVKRLQDIQRRKIEQPVYYDNGARSPNAFGLLQTPNVPKQTEFDASSQSSPVPQKRLNQPTVASSILNYQQQAQAANSSDEMNIIHLRQSQDPNADFQQLVNLIPGPQHSQELDSSSHAKRRTKSKNKVILPKIMFFDKNSQPRDRKVSQDIQSWIDNENAIAAAVTNNILGQVSKDLNQSNFSVQVQHNSDLMTELAARSQSQAGLKRVEGSFDSTMNKYQKKAQPTSQNGQYPAHEDNSTVSMLSSSTATGTHMYEFNEQQQQNLRKFGGLKFGADVIQMQNKTQVQSNNNIPQQQHQHHRLPTFQNSLHVVQAHERELSAETQNRQLPIKVKKQPTALAEKTTQPARQNGLSLNRPFNQHQQIAQISSSYNNKQDQDEVIDDSHLRLTFNKLTSN